MASFRSLAGPPGPQGIPGATGPKGETVIIHPAGNNTIFDRDSGKHSIVWKGPWSEDKTSFISYVNNGGHVVINIESVKAISSKGEFIQSGKLPINIIPKTTIEKLVPLFESIRISGLVKITSDGQIIYSNHLGNPFLSGLMIGWNKHSIDYYLE